MMGQYWPWYMCHDCGNVTGMRPSCCRECGNERGFTRFIAKPRYGGLLAGRLKGFEMSNGDKLTMEQARVRFVPTA